MLERKLKFTDTRMDSRWKESSFGNWGARQIGKTFLIRECLEESKKEFVEINFIEQPELIQLFKNTKNVNDFLMRLSLATNKTIIKNETIFFFDEIQEVKK